MSLPADFQHAQIFLARLEQVYSASGAQEIVQALAEDCWHAFWINPLIDTCPADFAPPGQPVPDMPGMWQVGVAEQLTHTTAASAGWIYIQNVSSYFAARQLGVQPGQEVLDLAAAPGGKTIVLAAAMQNRGRLAAVEPVKARFHRLRANLQRCGVTNVALYQRDGRGVGRAVPQRFDRVLLDAPCSSESHMRWDTPASYQHWSLRKVKECQRKQKGLLRSAYAALKPGGEMIYCTCSFSPEENELVVDYLLKRSDAQIIPLQPPGPEPVYAVPGLQSWGGKTLSPTLGHTLRILPHGAWDGFYVARLRRPA
ncbi:MAG: RsmB/NOP family class I SAM-dependent RNA methyltransferase [Pseudomonadota bacterium]